MEVEMANKLETLIRALELLKATVDKAVFNDNAFDQQHGWNQVHLHKNNISQYIDSYIEKLDNYGDNSIPEAFIDRIDNHVENITRLNNTSVTYFSNNAQYLLHNIPSIILTLNTIFNDIDNEIFSFESIQDNKLLPKGLSARLRGTKKQIDSLSESSEGLRDKVAIINDAHSAAESLPTDLASLQEAKQELSDLINTARKELSSTKDEISALKLETASMRNDAKKASVDADSYKSKAEASSIEAKKLVEQCDDALQITTTQGLAAGFDQKAKELKNSIWVWIIGLLIALVAGALIGEDRVTAFTSALESELTAGQAMLHTIMSIFSIGGPLWLAWISTQQINQRFKLSEDYSYKATVAKSFTGFSKFAERFDPTTEERLFNSTLDRLDEMPLRLIEGRDYNSPWHEFTDSESFKSAIEMIPSLAKEAGKFASKTELKKKPKQPKKSKNQNKAEPNTEVLDAEAEAE